MAETVNPNEQAGKMADALVAALVQQALESLGRSAFGMKTNHRHTGVAIPTPIITNTLGDRPTADRTERFRTGGRGFFAPNLQADPEGLFRGVEQGILPNLDEGGRR